MSESNGLVDALVTAGSSPKAAAVVATTTTTIGAAAKLDAIQGVLSTASLFVGLLTGTVVLAIQMIKLVRYWRSLSIDPKDVP